MLTGAMQSAVDRRANGAAVYVTEHDEERGLQMMGRVLQAARDLR
jgi:hypothetical protein